MSQENEKKRRPSAGGEEPRHPKKRPQPQGHERKQHVTGDAQRLQHPQRPKSQTAGKKRGKNTKKNENVTVVMYTLKRTKLSQGDVDNFNSQYPLLEVRYTRVFHDRFLILDKKNAYHIGASLKDAGKKCFGITLIEDDGIVRDILQRLELETEEQKSPISMVKE